MVHKHLTALLVIAGVYALLITLTAASCLGLMFGVYGVLGALMGGGVAWARSRSER